MRRAKKIGIVCVGILMVVFMFLSYSNLFGGETKRDITKISVIGIKRKNSQVEDFKRGIEEAANAKRVDVEYLEIEEDYDTIKEYIDREIKNGSQALIVFSEKEEQILSYLQSEKKKIPLIRAEQKKKRSVSGLMCRIWQNVWQKKSIRSVRKKSRWYI